MVVRGRLSPGDQGTAARASSAMCPMVVAVIVVRCVAVAVVLDVAEATVLAMAMKVSI